MQRTRNEERWKVDFDHHECIDSFTARKRGAGAHSILVNGQPLDFLVEDRGADTTLVAFSGALSLAAKFTPAFSGLKVAEDTDVNLIAVADPSMSMGEITVAWYLGNRTSGPLKPYLVRAIQHLIDGLGSTRTILFGGSGGGYAAAHLAFEFPNSIAFIFNPRLTLERRAERALKRYFKACHGTTNRGRLTSSDRNLLHDYGPIDISALATAPLKHDFLIYQNLLDPEFIEHQLFPFLEEMPRDDRLRLRFSVDNPGHTPIPGDTVREIIRTLSQHESQELAIRNAGFLSQGESITSAVKQYPAVGRKILESRDEDEREVAIAELREDLTQQEHALRKALQEAKDNRTRQIRFRKWGEALEATLQEKSQKVETLEREIEKLEDQLSQVKSQSILSRMRTRLRDPKLIDRKRFSRKKF